MLLKTFILDSETKLTLEHSKTGYTYLVGNRPVSYGNDALVMAETWVENFALRYPGYAAKMRNHFEQFTSP